MLRLDAEKIYKYAINSSLPDAAVERAIRNLPDFCGRLILVAIGKAAWQMAHCANEILGERIDEGIVITKYGHSRAEIGNIEIYEAAHPVPDERGLSATRRALEITKGLSRDDLVLFLISGGGSALFESVDCPLSELSALTSSLLASGASIEEINTVRKHISNVKGGRFAQHVYPARVFAVVLSDIIGSPLDMIASGPATADTTTSADALSVIDKYSIKISEKVRALLLRETPKVIDNSTHIISGSVAELCVSAARAAEELGYKAHILTDCLSCEAREAGAFLASVAKTHSDSKERIAFIAGGETVVHISGDGRGGRNQEMALAAAEHISGLCGVAFFSIGSDGTDGPTDAAGGYADGETKSKIERSGKTLLSYLDNNDSYSALSLSDGLIFTGATGTNVNDLSVVLISPEKH